LQFLLRTWVLILNGFVRDLHPVVAGVGTKIYKILLILGFFLLPRSESEFSELANYRISYQELPFSYGALLSSSFGKLRMTSPGRAQGRRNAMPVQVGKEY
jgi:hypothetical protein